MQRPDAAAAPPAWLGSIAPLPQSFTADEARQASISLSDEVQLLVIWQGAMSKSRQILRDIQANFIVLAVSYFDWPSFRDQAHGPRAFEDNLWRLYSGKGGWAREGMKLKVKQCGFGPFIAVVVLDPEPNYRVEATAHGDDTVNVKMNAAKKRYRGWTGGGFKVHGTTSGAEAFHDIPLLFHRMPSAFLNAYRKYQVASALGLTERFVRWAECGPVPQLAKNKPGDHRCADAPHAEGNTVDDGQSSSDSSVDDAARTWSRLAQGDCGECLVRWPEVAEDGDVGRANPPLVVLPLRTTFQTMGLRQWSTCMDFVTALAPYKTELRASRVAGAAALRPKGLPTSCDDWPTQSALLVNAGQRWALLAVLAGTQSPDRHGGAGESAPPPGDVHVGVAGRTLHFELGLLN
jgi:hypothetical protein